MHGDRWRPKTISHPSDSGDLNTAENLIRNAYLDEQYL